MREVLLPQEMVHTGDLILVNAQFPFRKTGTDRFLLPASFGGNRVLLDGRVARLLEKLVLDLGGGEALCPVSGWRSREEQEAIYTRSLQEHGRRFTEQYVALPGHSEHQTGLAVDLGLRSDRLSPPRLPLRGNLPEISGTSSLSWVYPAVPPGEKERHRHCPRALAFPLCGGTTRGDHGGQTPGSGGIPPVFAAISHREAVLPLSGQGAESVPVLSTGQSNRPNALAPTPGHAVLLCFGGQPGGLPFYRMVPG